MSSDHPIVTERRKVREKPILHFRRVAKMWEAIIGSPVSPKQVLLCMAALKIAREAGAHEPDNVEDATGYLSLIPEILEYNQQMMNPDLVTKVPQGGALGGVREERAKQAETWPND